jgi:hypothetical protein
MANTIQAVLWALGKQCALRQQPDWEKPGTALKTLSYCRTYSQLRKCEDRGYGVFGDVCVTGVTPASLDKGSYYVYPASGFVLSSQFAPLGGLLLLHQLCANCPANLDAGGIAGCVGGFSFPFRQWLYSQESQKELDDVINRLGIGARLDSIFPQTRLHWFRFWIHSPIPPEGAALLRQLFQAIRDDDAQKPGTSANPDSGQRVSLGLFIAALDRSLKSNIPLHVHLGPPGHTDFGYCTTFPHCPRCKAAAPGERWKRKYPDNEIACEICGTSFSPAKTYSSEHDDLDHTDLRETLGQTAFEKLAAQCLMVQGLSETEAAEFVRKHEEWERARRERWAKEMEPSRRHEAFVQNVIYRGLKKLPRHEKGQDGWLYSAADVEEILRRCKSYRGKVRSIMHVSESGELDEIVQVSFFTSPQKALQKLREKGCNEKFSTTLKFPEEIVSEWHARERE